MGVFLVSGQHGRLSAVLAMRARSVWREVSAAGTGVQLRGIPAVSRSESGTTAGLMMGRF